MDLREKVKEHLEAATEGDVSPAMHLGAAGIYALLHVADTIKLSLRDIVYELRD